MILKNNFLITIFLNLTIYLYLTNLLFSSDLLKFNLILNKSLYYVVDNDYKINDENKNISDKVILFLEKLLSKEKNEKELNEIKSEIIEEPYDEQNLIKYEKFVSFEKAELKILDKVQNKNLNIMLEKNKYVIFFDLNIKMEKCFKSDEIENNQSIIFLEVMNKFDDKEIFNGWIFSRYRNLTYLDHQRFDFIVARCI